MDIILILCSILVIGAVFVNVFSFYKLKRCRLNEKYYWELKFYNQFMIGLFTVVIAVATFLGFNSFANLKSSITKTINEQIEEIVQKKFGESVEIVGKKADAIIQENSKNAESLKIYFKKSNLIESNIGRLEEQIQQKFYIVQNVKTKIAGVKIFFKDLKTMQNEFLPEFQETPVVFVNLRTPGELPVIGTVEVTKEYIHLFNCNNELLDLLIIEK